MQPLVSIIIPTYDRAHLLGETLDSVLTQTYKNWECIVVDDGSTDPTDELMEFYCERDTRIQYYHRPKGRPKGANACRNYGFELSKGEYINWFDSDDLMDPQKLYLQVLTLQDSHFNFSISQTLKFETSKSNIIGLKCKDLHSENIFFNYLIQHISWLTQAPIWKRSFLESQDALFDEELQAAQEWEFFCRILSSFPDYFVIEKPLQLLRIHMQSITYNENKNLRMWNYYLARNKIYYNQNISLDEHSRKYLQNYLLYYFKEYTRNRDIKKALASFYVYILSEKFISSKGKGLALLGAFSYWITGKGDRFLRNISF